ncbi:MAG: hypothetical protein HYV93_15105 [Candidatus Rokubacteria bacterium]|nr:hypothetical protein [Candidatus Rokubacteria bacterium]
MLDTLLGAGAYADVVRESQDVVELVLKGALRFGEEDAREAVSVVDRLLDLYRRLVQAPGGRGDE